MAEYDYDMIVVGSGPAGQRAAIQAAKLHKRVAVVEKRGVVGGVCINLGTIPSKTLREAAMHLSGYRERGLYGASYRVKDDITMDDLMFRTNHVVRHEIDIVRHQLQRNRVDLINAKASLVDSNTVRLEYIDGRGARDVKTHHVVLAVGTKVYRPDTIAFDGKRVFTSDDIFTLNHLSPNDGCYRRRGYRNRICQHLCGPRCSGDYHRKEIIFCWTSWMMNSSTLSFTTCARIESQFASAKRSPMLSHSLITSVSMCVSN